MADYIRNDDLKQYLDQIKSLLPIFGKPEKKFISDLESNMRDFIRHNPGCTLTGLYDRYGKPVKIVKDYYTGIDKALLFKRLNTSKWLKRAVAIAFILILLCNCFIWALICIDRIEAEKASENLKVIVNDSR